MNKSMRIGILIQGVSVVICIISLRLPQWYTAEHGHVGLFKMCIFDVCAAIKNAPDWIEGSQATMIMGFLAQCLSIAVCVLYTYNMEDKRYLSRFAFFASFAAGIFICICVIRIGTKKSHAEKRLEKLFNKIDIDFGASFYLAIVALLLSLVSGYFFYKIPCPENNVTSNVDSVPV